MKKGFGFLLVVTLFLLILSTLAQASPVSIKVAARLQTYLAYEDLFFKTFSARMKSNTMTPQMRGRMAGELSDKKTEFLNEFGSTYKEYDKRFKSVCSAAWFSINSGLSSLYSWAISYPNESSETFMNDYKNAGRALNACKIIK
jgi:hypothetical protein